MQFIILLSKMLLIIFEGIIKDMFPVFDSQKNYKKSPTGFPIGEICNLIILQRIGVK